MSTFIRLATLEDAGAIAALLTELGYPASAEEIPGRLRHMLAEPGQNVLVAEERGRVIGLATVIMRHVIHDDAPVARLAALVVGEAQRGHGVGSAMLAETERIARQGGCSLIEVTSGLHRPEAHAFYRGHGYEERPRRFLKRLDGTD